MKRLGFLMAGLIVLVAAQTASAGIISDLANATILEEFLFDDPSGTSYDAAANNINGGNLLTSDSDLAGVTTNGSGCLMHHSKQILLLVQLLLTLSRTTVRPGSWELWK